MSQEAWVELAAGIREQLANRVGSVADMKPEEIGQFVDACQAAMFLEENAETFDKDVELQLARVVFGD